MSTSIDVYKIKFKCDGWFCSSTRYYSASSANEALKDLNYAMQHNMVSSERITIINISMYNRYSVKWERQDMNLLNTGYDTDNKHRIILSKSNVVIDDISN